MNTRQAVMRREVWCGVSWHRLAGRECVQLIDAQRNGHTGGDYDGIIYFPNPIYIR